MVIIQNNQLFFNKNNSKSGKIEAIFQNQNYKNNSISTSSNSSNICKITFKGKTINDHYYTDQEYVDAMNYKDRYEWESNLLSDIYDRYGFWQYVFTFKPDEHVAEVKKCVSDIKAEEEKEAKKAKELEDKEKRLIEELEKANAKPIAREKAIAELSAINPNKGLGNCNISDGLREILIEEFVIPFAVDQINREEGLPTEVPNGLLLYGSDSDKSVKTARALAEQVLQDKFSSNFKEVSIKNNNFSKFEDELKDIKEKASIKYEKTGQRNIILIKDFDKIAFDNDHPEYNPQLNSFLKLYFLDCAESGCTILATAKNIDNIENPFIVNKKRFAIKEPI